LLWFLLFAAPATGLAQNGTTTVTPVLMSTFENISVKCPFTGDANGSNSAVVEFKPTADSSWITAYAPFIDRRATIGGATNQLTIGGATTSYANQARVSIVGLTADTSYDVRCTWTDADAVSGTNPISATISTLDPTPPSANSGNATCNATDSATLNTCNSGTVPGDVVELSAAASYNAFVISRSGDSTHWITYRCTNASAAINNTLSGGASATRNILVSADYIIIEDCVIPSSRVSGIEISSNRHHILIQDNSFQDVLTTCNTTTSPDGAGVTIGGDAHDVYVLRNTVSSTALQAAGCTASPVYAGPGTGIQWFSGGYTIVAADNTVNLGFRDCIATDNSNNVTENIDILRNTCNGYKDDGPETKGSSVNVRIGENISNLTTTNYGNTCVATNANVATVQQGPVYVYRNRCYATGTNAGGLIGFKIAATTSQAQYFFHNTLHLRGADFNYDCFSTGATPATSPTQVYQNNICTSKNGVFIGGGATPGVTSNRNLFFNNGNDWAYLWNDGTPHSYAPNANPAIAGLCVNQSQDCNSVYADPSATLDANLNLTANTSPAYNAGMTIANFNDANSAWPAKGGVPDIGAHEFQVGLTPGSPSTITASLITSTTLRLCWNKGSDDVDTQSQLQYEVRKSASNNISSVANAEANGTIAQAYTTDISCADLTGLTPLATMYFNVIIKDTSANKAVYTTVSATTLCGATKLSFTTQPTNVVLGATLGTVRVSVLNASDTVCTDSSITVTLSEAAGSTWGTLNGTLARSVSAGVGVWNDLTITGSTGSGSIKAAASGLTDATSNSITISAAPVGNGRGAGRLIFR
jgi:hypothetical protein